MIAPSYLENGGTVDLVEEVKVPEDCGSTFKWPNYWLLVSYHIGFDVRLLIVPQAGADGFNTQDAPILVFNRMGMTSSPCQRCAPSP